MDSGPTCQTTSVSCGREQVESLKVYRAVGRLGYPVKMIGRVGTDSFGSQLITDVGSMGVDCSRIGTSEGSSGAARDPGF